MAEDTSGRWARQVDIDFGALKGVQRGLTVESIMTPRGQLKTCRPEESVRAVVSRNTGRYSFLPVQDEKNVIRGLYRAELWFDPDEEPPEQPICKRDADEFIPLAETLVVGADAKIIDFLTSAHEQPVKLVVSDHGVAGLVSLSDLQQLPVRAALFTLITTLEMVMAKWIETHEDTECWLALLSEGRREKVRDNIKNLQESDNFVSEILCTEFTDKCTIIRKRAPIPASRSRMGRDFKAIRELRDQLAHASHYARTPQEAREVCCLTGRILERCKQILSDKMDSA